MLIEAQGNAIFKFLEVAFNSVAIMSAPTVSPLISNLTSFSPKCLNDATKLSTAKRPILTSSFSVTGSITSVIRIDPIFTTDLSGV